MTKEDKLNEGQIQLNVKEHYRPLKWPMVEETPVGRPIISGCDGPNEKLSSFVDKILQPIAQQQKSYLKDKTDFINFMNKTP